MTPAEELGPIRPEHAGDGWRLEGDERRGWYLARRLYTLRAQIKGSSPTSCVWTVYAGDGHVLRKATYNDVDKAKEDGEKWMWSWVQEHPTDATH